MRWNPAVTLAVVALLASGAGKPPPGSEYSKGIAAFKQGDFIPAAHHFYRALQTRPADLTILSWYANALLRAGEQDKAVQVYQRIMALDPHSPAAEQARQILEQLTGQPQSSPSPGKAVPGLPTDAGLLSAYGQAMQEINALNGYHMQVLALERGVIAAPQDMQAAKSLLALAFNPGDSTLTAVGIGQGWEEQKGVAAATIEATRWLATLVDWHAGKLTAALARKKSFNGLAKVIAKEKLSSGWVVVMVAKIARPEPSPVQTPP